MRTYILRDPSAVEPQIKSLVTRTNPKVAATTAASDSVEVRRYGVIGGSHDDVLKLMKKLQAAHPGVALKFC